MTQTGVQGRQKHWVVGEIRTDRKAGDGEEEKKSAMIIF